MIIDEENIWAIHCNLTMIAVDAGAFVIDANLSSAEFIKNAYEIDVRKLPEWKSCDLNTIEPLMMVMYEKAIRALPLVLSTNDPSVLRVIVMYCADRINMLQNGDESGVYSIRYPDIYRAIEKIGDANVVDCLMNRALFALNNHRIDSIRNLIPSSGQ